MRMFVVAALASLVACQGSIDGPDGQGGPNLVDSQVDPNTGLPLDPNGTAGSGAPTTGGDGAGASCSAELPPARAVLTPLRQFQNSLRDLFGPEAVRDEDAVAGLEFEVIDRARMTTSMLDQILRLAETATESLRGRTAQVVGCASLDDRTCVREGVGKIARRTFKRPLEASELDGLMALYDESLVGDTAPDAAESATLLALTAAVTAPSALYRTEFEQPLDTSAGATTRSLSPHELAAALAALLLDSVPDEDLLSAADDGSLATEAGLTTQLDRLLAMPRVRDHLTQVMLHAFGAPKLFQSPKDSAVFPEYTGALQLSMYEETRLFLEDLLWTRSAPLTELLTARQSFADPALAELYGVPYPGTGDEFVPLQLPPTRAGLLTQPAMLSVLSRTDKTSVVARGLFVRGAMLCLPKIDAPPADVQAQVNEQLQADASQEELAAYRATTLPCSGCHSQFDRFGLVLERFDAIGRERAAPPQPVDLTGLFTFQGTVDGPIAMLQQMADSPAFVDCMAERVLSYALSEAAVTGSLCLPDELAAELHAGSTDIRTLLHAVTRHPSFGQRSAGEL